MREKALAYLHRDYLLNVDMIECIRRDIGTTRYASDCGVLIQAHNVYMLSCDDRELGLTLLKSHDASWVVLHQMDMRESLAQLGYHVGEECWQGAYTKGVPLEETCTDIRRLDKSFAHVISENYELEEEQEIAELLEKGILNGAFLDGEFAGFMGRHSEGSLGMLYVFPPFRRQGIAEALERNYVNQEIALGHVPYGQIFVGNTASRRLQEKLGMEFSERNICWCAKI